MKIKLPHFLEHDDRGKPAGEAVIAEATKPKEDPFKHRKMLLWYTSQSCGDVTLVVVRAVQISESFKSVSCPNHIPDLEHLPFAFGKFLFAGYYVQDMPETHSNGHTKECLHSQFTMEIFRPLTVQEGQLFALEGLRLPRKAKMDVCLGE